MNFPTLMCLPEPPADPVDIAKDLELPIGETGEIVVSGWHVNTGQVGVGEWPGRDGCGWVGQMWEWPD